MSILPESVTAYIGMETTEVACEVVERGAVRRFAQAVMDADPIYREPCAANAHCGGPVAPALYPMYMINWRQFGDADSVQQHAQDPHFDGTAGLLRGLPEIEPLKHLAVLNGGSEIEFYRYARHGETVKLRSRYTDIVEKQTRTGPMVIVTSENDYLTGDGELLLRVRRSSLRRPAEPPGRSQGDNEVAAKTDNCAKRLSCRSQYRNAQHGGCRISTAMTSTHLFFEDVAVGDDLPCLPKGPLTSVHLMRWSAAIENWHKIHYDRPFAVTHDGLPDLLVNGSFKQQFIVQLLKDWVGPAGWVWKASFQFRAMNLVGDSLSVWARVTAKRDVPDFGLVELELGIVNAEGKQSTPGKATVALPYRGRGAVPYPFVAPSC